jgi:hypothetical protein
MTNTDTSPEGVERFKFQGMAVDDEGMWVRYSDYAALSAALEAEKERAETAENTLALCEDQRREWDYHCKTAEAERDALKAENARLREAADISATIANGALDTTAREATLRRDLSRVRDELRSALQEPRT